MLWLSHIPLLQLAMAMGLPGFCMQQTLLLTHSGAMSWKSSIKYFPLYHASERRQALPFWKSQPTPIPHQHPMSLPNGGKKMRTRFSEFSLLSSLWSCPTLSLLFAIIINLYLLPETPFSSLLFCAGTCLLQLLLLTNSCDTTPLMSPFKVYQNQESGGFTVLSYFLQSGFYIFNV